MKKSGLADSPFFVTSTSREVYRPASTPPSPMEHVRNLYQKPPEQMNNRTVEPVNEGTPEQMNTHADERLNERSDVQVNSRTGEPVEVKESAEKKPERPIHRQSYDLYDDQAEAIEALCLKWRKERGRHITKGEAMRELLDEILAFKK